MSTPNLTINPRTKNLVGRVYGRWEVVDFAGIGKYGESLWHCRCHCGHTRNVDGRSLTSGKSKSCGCLSNEIHSKMLNVKNTTHGLSGTHTYKCWKAMTKRCRSLKDKTAKDYALRGIAVCPRWLGEEGFENFLADMGERPPGTTIDRIDNNGDYEPSNCRWATIKEQARNKRNNRILVFYGQALPVSVWAEILAIPKQIIYSRLHRGWSTKRTLITPVKRIK